MQLNILLIPNYSSKVLFFVFELDYFAQGLNIALRLLTTRAAANVELKV